MKLILSVVPTQTNQNTVLPAASILPAEGASGSDAGESIAFDGKTFTVTFSQISGEKQSSVYLAGELLESCVIRTHEEI